MNLCKEEFNITEHNHKFAVWAAGRAASVKDQRFDVESAKKLIDFIDLKQYIDQPDRLPDDFDAEHHKWCTTICQQAKIKMHYGVAAKLINVYLKAILVCGGKHTHRKVKMIHPPIDRLLFKGLVKCNVGGLKDYWKQYLKTGNGWSQFDEKAYKEVIEKIRTCLAKDHGLFEIEHYWIGFQ